MRNWQLLIGAFLFTTATFIIIQSHLEEKYSKRNEIFDNRISLEIEESYFEREVETWKKLRENISLSTLGGILFRGDLPPQNIDNEKKFEILVWKYGKTIENRHIKQFEDTAKDPFKYCSVKNCKITYEDSAIETADLVLFHLHRIRGLEDLPKNRRDPNQIWAFLTDESPHNTFMKRAQNRLKNYNGQFNWSMTYRMNSDIPVPYGRTVLKEIPNFSVQLNKDRSVLVAVMGSNCGGVNHRWQYIRELEKYIKIDKYGGCGNLVCPGHFWQDCPALDKYLFYLSFENSNCEEYITEKVWWNAYAKFSIPIVMGASKLSYRTILPPNSYLNVDDFASPKDLAEYIKLLNRTDDYKNLHVWRKYFDVLNEHGYFHTHSFHYCRICEALNYNSKEHKVYEKLEDFWSVDKDCHPAWNA